MGEIEKLMELKRNGLIEQVRKHPEDMTWLVESIKGYQLSTSTPIDAMLYLHDLQQILKDV